MNEQILWAVPIILLILLLVYITERIGRRWEQSTHLCKHVYVDHQCRCGLRGDHSSKYHSQKDAV